MNPLDEPPDGMQFNRRHFYLFRIVNEFTVWSTNSPAERGTYLHIFYVVILKVELK